jgi:hypothetical protein
MWLPLHCSMMTRMMWMMRRRRKYEKQVEDNLYAKVLDSQTLMSAPIDRTQLQAPLIAICQKNQGSGGEWRSRVSTLPLQDRRFNHSNKRAFCADVLLLNIQSMSQLREEGDGIDVSSLTVWLGMFRVCR